MILNIITIVLILFYIIFILLCLKNWIKIDDKSPGQINSKVIKVSVIVPVRNEAENLQLLLQSLAFQNYPYESFQIIISDDHSTDNSFEVAENYFKNNNIPNGICLRSPKQSKKEAITFAVRNSEAELIITSDADTTRGEYWISAIVQEYVCSGAYLICGPVKLCGEDSFLGKLQSAEFSGLSGIGAFGISVGLPMFCNGANLSFSKKIFEDINGYENSISFSGDDTQLMLKIHKSYPGKISYLKDSRAIVQTNVLTRKSELWQQRRRWASKIPLTLSSFTVFISVLVWLVHAFLLIQLISALIQFNFLLLFLLFIMIVVPEIVYLKVVGKFFKQKINVWMIFFVQPLYSIYIVCIGFLAPLGTYQWKGRNLR